MTRILTALAGAALVLCTAPAQAQDAAAGERLASARETVDHVFPAGTYARLMEGTLDTVMNSVMGQIGELPLAQLARMGGLSEEEVAGIGEARLAEIMAIYDPHYDERMQLTMNTMFAGMAGVMGRLEPEMRAGLAEAYAARFTTGELQELNAFFATPAGAHYASESMLIWVDPAVTAKMEAIVPVLVEEMPAVLEKVAAATAHLPEPRGRDDLTPEEQARLEELFGGAGS